MGDDLVTDGILPAGSTTVDADFDPNAVESDDFLDDPQEAIIPDVVDVAVAASAADDDDDEILDE